MAQALSKTPLDGMASATAAVDISAGQSHAALKAQGDGVPVWRSSAFAGLFLDPYVDETELEGGQVAPVIDAFVPVVRRVLAAHSSGTSDTVRLSHTITTHSAMATLTRCALAHHLVQDESPPSTAATVAPAPSPCFAHVLDRVAAQYLPALCRACDALAAAAALDRRIQAARDGGAEALVRVIADVGRQLRELAPGEVLAFPGGWRDKSGGHALFHVIEAGPDSTLSFVVCNTGDGCEFHEASIADFPKAKYRTALRIRNIPTERVADEGFLYMLFQMRTTRKADNCAEVMAAAAAAALTTCVEKQKAVN